MVEKIIYLDHAAATPLDPRVFLAMKPFFTEKFGNPSSLHQHGCSAKQAIERARKDIAGILNCQPNEIIFEGSGTESINHAIIGAAYANQGNGKHIVTSAIEHHAVLHACQFLASQGFEVTYLPVDKYGIVKLEELKKIIRPETIFVSIMLANNEIGTIQPIREIEKLIKLKNKNILLHTDACQAAGYLDLNVENLGVDLLTLNGSKIYGPKGVGLLYVRHNVLINSIMHGGAQENGRRAGTENVPNIIGLTKALKLSQATKDSEAARLAKLRDLLIKELLKIKDVILNGHPIKRLPNNLNVSFEQMTGQQLMQELDKQGIEVSTGSACTSGSLEPSHVILALGRNLEQAKSSLRFSLGQATTEAEIRTVIKTVREILKKAG